MRCLVNFFIFSIKKSVFLRQMFTFFKFDCFGLVGNFNDCEKMHDFVLNLTANVIICMLKLVYLT